MSRQFTKCGVFNHLLLSSRQVLAKLVRLMNNEDEPDGNADLLIDENPRDVLKDSLPGMLPTFMQALDEAAMLKQISSHASFSLKMHDVWPQQ